MLSLRILFNYNLPIILWLGAAGMAACGVVILKNCYVEQLLAWCPGCGLTHDLLSVLTGSSTEGVFIYFILAGFVCNFLYSLRRAWSHTAT